MNLPAHVEHFRGGNVFSLDRARRTDASETDAAAMAKAMAKAAPDTAPGQPNADPERQKVIARLNQEGRSPEYIDRFLEGFDEARRSTDLTHAHFSGRKEGKEITGQAHAAIERAAEEKRTDANDAAIMARAMRGTGAPARPAPVVRTDARDGRTSAAERAREANEARMRNAWQGPQQTPETRQDEARDQRPAARPATQHADGPRLSASERAKRANEERQRTAWQQR